MKKTGSIGTIKSHNVLFVLKRKGAALLVPKYAGKVAVKYSSIVERLVHISVQHQFQGSERQDFCCIQKSQAFSSGQVRGTNKAVCPLQ